MKKRRKIEIWVDGSCHPQNPGNGGWGAVLKEVKPTVTRYLEVNGYMPGKITNNQSETKAVTESIRLIKYPSIITVYTDSSYVCKGFARYARGRPLLESNAAYWKELVEVIEAKDHDVTVIWVKGHNGNELNHQAHNLAYSAASTGEEIRVYKEEANETRAGEPDKATQASTK